MAVQPELTGGPSARLTDAEVAALDPYAFLAVLGKRVIHPGGRRATEELFRLAELAADQRVLDVGCGVGTTAIAVARRFGSHGTAVEDAKPPTLGFSAAFGRSGSTALNDAVVMSCLEYGVLWQVARPVAPNA